MNPTRRNFLKKSAAVLAWAAVSSPLLAAEKTTGVKRNLKKGIMFATIGVPGSVMEKFKAVKEAGFAGVEPMSHMNQEEVLKARDETGLKIPSVCCSTHWKENLASADAAERERGLNGLKQTLQDAKKYGASSVLFIPGIVSKDVSYADAYTRSQTELRKAVPLAEELGVKIALENVWNNFLLSPLEAARYVDEMKSSAVGWHFDVGNILRSGWPEQWISVLGNRIQKLHIKEFSRTKMNDAGLWKGFEVNLQEGDNDWSAVMQALDKIHYEGWGIAEQQGANSPEGLKSISERMDRIFAL
ncbi:MAG: sugar phosphate isomerase/epimerase family protein [Verrucomicrobiota bacterium]